MTVYQVGASVTLNGAPHRSKTWKDLDCMSMGTVRQWTRRIFNFELSRASPNVIVFAFWSASMKQPPYTRLSGRLSGVNGKTMRDEL